MVDQGNLYGHYGQEKVMDKKEQNTEKNRISQRLEIVATYNCTFSIFMFDSIFNLNKSLKW